MDLSKQFIEYPKSGVLIVLNPNSELYLIRKISMSALTIVSSVSDDRVFWIYKNREGSLGEHLRTLLDQVFEEYEITTQGTIRISDSDVVQLRLLFSLG